MTSQHFVVLGLARARSAWFRDLGGWATSAAVPCDFVKCVSAHELRARLESGRPFSAVIIDGSLTALDRDLVDAARSTGCPVIAVHDGRASGRDWSAIGVSAVLNEPLHIDEFVATLDVFARPLERFDATSTAAIDTGSDAGWISPLIAIAGPGGSGTSTAAIALADGLAGDPRLAGRVLLADMALDADLAMLHDTGHVVPGLQELVEAFRSGNPSSEEIRSMTMRPAGRGYHLLTGLRRHRDWVTLRPRSFRAALDALRRTFTMVVVDIDADLEGADNCGSADVEDRNIAARVTTACADVVVVTGAASTLGLHKQVRVIDGLLRHNVDPHRILPVLLGGPRNIARRFEFARSLAELTTQLPGGPLPASPVFIPTRRHIDRDIRDATRPQRNVVGTITSAVEATLKRVGPPMTALDPEPEMVVPGSLGSWAPEELTG